MEHCRAREAQVDLVSLQAAVLPNSRLLEKIRRYETHLNRQFLRALTTLQQLQKSRQNPEPEKLQNKPGSISKKTKFNPIDSSLASLPESIEILAEFAQSENCKTNPKTLDFTSEIPQPENCKTNSDLPQNSAPDCLPLKSEILNLKSSTPSENDSAEIAKQPPTCRQTPQNIQFPLPLLHALRALANCCEITQFAPQFSP